MTETKNCPSPLADLPPSDDPASEAGPGIRPPDSDWKEITDRLNSLAAKIFELKCQLMPVVIRRGGGLFRLYSTGESVRAGQIVVQACAAQTIKDYCDAMMPNGTKIQWIVLP
jgi:hypothetical protein